MDRIVLHTDHSGFEKAVKAYGDKTQLQQNIKLEMKRLIPDYKVTNDFFKDINLNFHKAIEEAYPEHVKLMKPHKVPEMIDMDITELEKLTSQYEDMKHVKNVSISSFEVLAETQQEIDDFKACQKLIKALKEFEKNTNRTMNAANVIGATNGMIAGITSMTQGAEYLKYNFQVVSEQRTYDRRVRK